ncbi:MAG: hypothetical protein IKO05_04180 [Selenomonadaceae bacterium]|nr:hypothetical protein [Selenomonadaceae bacterium]
MQNLSSLPWRAVLIGLRNIFCLINQLSLCSSKEKVAKRKDASQGRLLVRELNVALIRARCCPLRRHHVFDAGEAVILDGLKLAAYQTVNAE